MSIQIDRSGQGHNWQNIDLENIPTNILEEIETEFIENKDAEEYVASNGQRYRLAPERNETDEEHAERIDWRNMESRMEQDEAARDEREDEDPQWERMREEQANATE